jgi:hypothetical protein
VSGEHDGPAGQVDIVEGERSDGLVAGGVRGGERHDQPLRRVSNCGADGADLDLSHRQQGADDSAASAGEVAGGVGEDQPAALGVSAFK